MKIVVTGGLGHIGSRLIRSLSRSFPNSDVVVLDSVLTQRYCSLFHLPDQGHFRFVQLDIVKDDILPYLEGAAAIVHLAAITDATQSLSTPEAVEATNFQGTERVAMSAAQAGVPLIFLSTTSLYAPKRAMVDDDASAEDVNPVGPYAETKWRSECLLATLGSTHGLRYIICRFGTIFGPSQGMRFHTAINRFCWQAALGIPLTVWRTALHQKRPYLDLSDAVSALEFIIDRQLFRNEMLNVVTVNTTVDTVVNHIREWIPDVSIRMIDSPLMNELSYDVVGHKLIREGFEFRGDLRVAIRDTIALIRNARR